MTFTLISQDDYTHFYQQAKEKSFLQSKEMATLLAKRGYQISYVGLKNDYGNLVIASLVYSKKMTGGLYMELNSGPVSLDNSYLIPFFDGLKKHAKEMEVIELVVKPYRTYQTFSDTGQPTSEPLVAFLKNMENLDYIHEGLKTGYPGGEPDWHYHKDLRFLTTETLFSSFSKKGKPLVKKAKTFGIQLKKLNRNELHIFKDITSATSERREYSDKSLEYYQDFYDSFGDQAEFLVATLNFKNYLANLNKEQDKLTEKINLLEDKIAKNNASQKSKNQLRELQAQFQTFETRKSEAKTFLHTYGDKDVVLAGSLFVYTSQEAVYLFSGSYPAFNKFYAPALLQEHAMLEALNRDIPLYNLLGITGVFDGSDGVLRFKQNFNGYIVRKIGTFRYSPKPLQYKLIKTLKILLRRH